MILRTSGIGVSIAFLREAQWGSRGREFDSRHSDQSQQIYLLAFLLQQKAGAGENPLSRPFCAMRGPSALHLAFHEVAHHLVQLAHGVLGTLGDLAGGAAHLALARVGGHDAGGAQCGTGGHADQERGGGACVFVFHRRHSLRIKIFGLRG